MYRCCVDKAKILINIRTFCLYFLMAPACVFGASGIDVLKVKNMLSEIDYYLGDASSKEMDEKFNIDVNTILEKYEKPAPLDGRLAQLFSRWDAYRFSEYLPGEKEKIEAEYTSEEIESVKNYVSELERYTNNLESKPSLSRKEMKAIEHFAGNYKAYLKSIENKNGLLKSYHGVYRNKCAAPKNVISEYNYKDKIVLFSDGGEVKISFKFSTTPISMPFQRVGNSISYDVQREYPSNFLKINPAIVSYLNSKYKSDNPFDFYEEKNAEEMKYLTRIKEELKIRVDTEVFIFKDVSGSERSLAFYPGFMILDDKALYYLCEVL